MTMLMMNTFRMMITSDIAIGRSGSLFFKVNVLGRPNLTIIINIIVIITFHNNAVQLQTKE